MSDLDVRLRQHLAMTVPPTPDGRDLTRALAAVLDLHKPNPVTGRWPYCEVCVGGYEGVSEWPCPTVRAIAKRLGVEVDGD